jgi:UDP-N-acetylmuramoylalanine--D-glutamate ligase
MSFDFVNKKIAVVGMARSGMAAAEVLVRRGAIVTLYDSKHPEELEHQLRKAGEIGAQAVSSAVDVDGADIAVISPGVRPDSQIMENMRGRGIEVWGEIEAAYQLSQAPILAVTGTNGKTTTALLLAEMVRASGTQCYAAGNIAAGDLALPLIRAADVASKDDVIVAEISSFQLETIRDFRPAVGAILNITPDHQDRQSWEQYVAAKWRLFENQRTTDTAVLSKFVPVPENSLSLESQVVYFDEVALPTWIDDILLPGEHNKLNLLAALCMAKSFGVSDNAIRSAALSFKGVVHRLEFLDRIEDVTYINNSMCTNNAAFEASLSAIRGPKVVIAGGVFKGDDMRQLAKSVATNDVVSLILFGRSASAIAEAVGKETSVKTVVVNDLASAFAAAVGDARRGDTVILNPGCTSLDQFKDFEDRGFTFVRLVQDRRKALEQ